MAIEQVTQQQIRAHKRLTFLTTVLWRVLHRKKHSHVWKILEDNLTPETVSCLSASYIKVLMLPLFTFNAY